MCSIIYFPDYRYAGALSFEFPLKTCRTCPKADMCPLARSKVATLNENHEAARKAINRQREDREINKRNRENGLKNFNRLVVENVFAFLEKLGIKVTPAYSLEMTKVHVGLIVTLSNMLKTVRKLKKLREKEKCQGESQKINGLERHISVLGANFLRCSV